MMVYSYTPGCPIGPTIYGVHPIIGYGITASDITVSLPGELPVGTAVDVVDDIVVEATGRDDTKSNTVPIRDRRASRRNLVQ